MSNVRHDAARLRLGLSPMDLWIEYFALGGVLDAEDLGAYLRGDRDVGDTDHDIISHALNEQLRDQGQNDPLAYRHA